MMEYEQVIRFRDLEQRALRIEEKIDYLIEKWFPEEAEDTNESTKADLLDKGLQEEAIEDEEDSSSS